MLLEQHCSNGEFFNDHTTRCVAMCGFGSLFVIPLALAMFCRGSTTTAIALSSIAIFSAAVVSGEESNYQELAGQIGFDEFN